MQVNHVYTGDCIEILREHVEDESVNVSFADPPYNISGESLEWEEKSYKKVNEQWDTMSDEAYLKFTKDWITETKRVLVPTGTMFICASAHNLAEVMLEVKKQKLKLLNLITWHKTNPMPNMTCRTLTHSSEFILWAAKGTGYTFNYWESKSINPARKADGTLKQMSDVWYIPRCGGKERVVDENGKTVHPTQKPEKLVERALKIACKPGDVVLDPFVGVGTTPVVANNLGLSWVAIDLDERYVKYAEARIKKFAGVASAWTPKSKSSEQKSSA